MRVRANSSSRGLAPIPEIPLSARNGGVPRLVRQRSGSLDMKAAHTAMFKQLEAHLAILDPWFEDQSNHECVYKFFEGIILHLTPGAHTSADEFTAAMERYLMQFIPVGGLEDDERAGIAKYKLFFIEVYQVLDATCIKHKGLYQHLVEAASDAVIDDGTERFLHAHVSKAYRGGVSQAVIKVVTGVQNYSNQLIDAMFGEGKLLHDIPYKKDDADVPVSKGVKNALGQLSAHCLQAYLSDALDGVVQGWKDNSGYDDDGVARGNLQYANGDWARRDFLTPLFAYKEHQNIADFETFFNAVIYILQSHEEKRAAQVKAAAQPRIETATIALTVAREALAAAQKQAVDPTLKKKKDIVAAQEKIDAEIAAAQAKVVEAEAELESAQAKAEKGALGPDDIYPIFESTIKLQLRAYAKEQNLADIQLLLATFERLLLNTLESACEIDGVIAQMVARSKASAAFDTAAVSEVQLHDQLTEVMAARIRRVLTFIQILKEIIVDQEAAKLTSNVNQSLRRSPSCHREGKKTVKDLVRQASLTQLPGIPKATTGATATAPVVATPAPAAVKVTPRKPVRVQKKLTRWQRFKKRWQSLSTKWKVLAGVAIVLEVAAVVALAILFPPSVIVTVPGVSIAVTTTMAIAAGGVVVVTATGTTHLVHIAKTEPEELTALPTPEDTPTPQSAARAAGVQLFADSHRGNNVDPQGDKPAMIGLGGTASASDGTAKTGRVVVPPQAGVASNSSSAGNPASLFGAVPAKAVVGACPRPGASAATSRKEGGFNIAALFGSGRGSSSKTVALPSIGATPSF